tara:strand:+ start:96 stop:407 length:312 start_codon:yes stop_codon:yes gene_type:complete
MTYKQFKQIIDWQIAHEKKIYDAYKLKIDLIETFDEQQRVVDELWKHILNKEGDEWLSWYLYEKDEISGKPRKDIKAHDGDVEICKDVKGLYDYLNKNKYFKL